MCDFQHREMNFRRRLDERLIIEIIDVYDCTYSNRWFSKKAFEPQNHCASHHVTGVSILLAGGIDPKRLKKYTKVNVNEISPYIPPIMC